MRNKKENREKVTCEIDPHNRLIIQRYGRISQLPRQVLTGCFKIDKEYNPQVIESIILKTREYSSKKIKEVFAVITKKKIQLCYGDIRE